MEAQNEDSLAKDPPSFVMAKEIIAFRPYDGKEDDMAAVSGAVEISYGACS